VLARGARGGAECCVTGREEPRPSPELGAGLAGHQPINCEVIALRVRSRSSGSFQEPCALEVGAEAQAAKRRAEMLKSRWGAGGGRASGSHLPVSSSFPEHPRAVGGCPAPLGARGSATPGAQPGVGSVEQTFNDARARERPTGAEQRRSFAADLDASAGIKAPLVAGPRQSSKGGRETGRGDAVTRAAWVNTGGSVRGGEVARAAEMNRFLSSGGTRRALRWRGRHPSLPPL